HLGRQRRGEDGRAQAAVEYQIPVAPFHLPERRLVIERELIAAPRVVDEQIEAALVAPDPVEERLDLRVVRVVAADSDAGAAAGGQLGGGVVDRPGAAERGRLAADGAAGHVDGGAL